MARICYGHSASCFIYSFMFQAISEKTLCIKDCTCYLKIIVTLIPIDSVTNWHLNTFLFFSVQLKRKLGSCRSGNKKHFCLSFKVGPRHKDIKNYVNLHTNTFILIHKKVTITTIKTMLYQDY